MLSVFPQLLTYSFFAPFFLRLLLGLYFLATALLHFKKNAGTPTLKPFWFITLGIGELCVGLLFVVGLWTQVMALLSLIYGLKMLFFKKGYFSGLVLDSRSLYLFIIVISLSILVLGPGIWAVDLPF